MQLEVGKIYEGKITGITKFGAFVELEPGTTGMVHISEVANTFVNEIREHLTEGQMVKVKVLSLSNDGKISLSVKKAVVVDNPPPRPSAPRPATSPRPGSSGGGGRFGGGGGGAPKKHVATPAVAPVFDPWGVPPPPKPSNPAEQGFEDMLSRFKQKSEEKQGDLRRAIDGKRRSPSKRAR